MTACLGLDGPEPWWRHNRDVAWGGFDPVAYWDHNYRSLRDDDRVILRIVGQFFQERFGACSPVRRVGLDVGSGANLYPALTMLPWCDMVVLTDHSPANVAWLEVATADLSMTWKPFWQELVNSAEYTPGDFSLVCERFGERTEVRRRSVFELSGDQRYDLGTMFFVAESLTNYPQEFEDATAGFLAALAPNAPFAAGFMDGSEGYSVNEQSFPAVRSVNVDRVTAVLEQLGADARVRKIDVPADDPLRDGYEGMIVAVGTVPGAGRRRAG